MASSSAPGSLEVIRSFVNTVEAEDEVDLLTADGSLAQWCAQAGLDDPLPSELASLRELREALRRVLESHAGAEDAQQAWRGLVPFACVPSFKMEVGPASRLMLAPQGKRVERLTGELFAFIFEAIASGTWRRLKACRKESCRWAFYDLSKNGSGAWCSMQVCGNRVKAQRRRRREKTGSSGARPETP